MKLVQGAMIIIPEYESDRWGNFRMVFFLKEDFQTLNAGHNFEAR